MTALKDHPHNTVTLSDEQFNKLVELLTPGFELSQMYLKQMHEHPEPAESDHVDPPKDAPPAAT